MKSERHAIVNMYHGVSLKSNKRIPVMANNIVPSNVNRNICNKDIRSSKILYFVALHMHFFYLRIFMKRRRNAQVSWNDSFLFLIQYLILADIEKEILKIDYYYQLKIFCTISLYIYICILYHNVTRKYEFS